MASIIKTNDGIFLRKLYERNKLIGIWEIGEVYNSKVGFSYGRICIKNMTFPPEYIGKKVRIKIEVVG